MSGDGPRFSFAPQSFAFLALVISNTALNHSLTHSHNTRSSTLTHLQSLTHSQSLARSLAYSPTLSHKFSDLLTQSLTHSLIHRTNFAFVKM